MSLDYNFDSDLGNYDPFGTALVEWTGGTGNPSPGCCHIFDDVGNSGWIHNSTDTSGFSPGLRFYVNYRIDHNNVGDHTGESALTFTVYQTASSYNESLDWGDVAPGWHQYVSNAIPVGSVVGFRVVFGGIVEAETQINVYIDTITFATSPPPISGADELRHLGMAADQAQLYLTANDGGTLKCYAYNLDTLALVNTASLGAATFVEVEARDRGVFPAVKPGEDGVIYLRGRDGNNVAVQRSDDGGATFGDLDDGGWATTKYAVGLLINPLHPDDLVAAFDDDDLYQSTDAGEAWAKLADAPGTLRAAGRHLIDAARLMLAAQAADTIHFTPNLGLTTEDVSDAALNTINVIEVSR